LNGGSRVSRELRIRGRIHQLRDTTSLEAWDGMMRLG
jgi:hypothetical protein